MSHKVAGLDHLRALAITIVFLFHYRLFPHPGWVDAIGSFGWTGVDLFFVLSGYLIAGQIFRGFEHSTFSLRAFFIKRSFRILPAYWIVVALYFLVPPFREWESLPPLWKLLSFTQNFGLDLRMHRTFSHAWSLCIEEQFYLLLPLSLLLIKRAKMWRIASWLLPGLCLAGLAVRLLSWHALVAPEIQTEAFGATWYKWMYYPTYNRLDGLLAGISIAAMHQYSARAGGFINRFANRLLTGGAILLGCAYWLCMDPLSFVASIFGFPLVSLTYGLMVAAVVSPGCLLNMHATFVTRHLATFSFSIYLTHKAAIHFAHALCARLEWNEAGSSTFLMSVAVTLVAAGLLHYSVEKPFLALRSRLLQKQASVPKGATGSE